MNKNEMTLALARVPLFHNLSKHQLQNLAHTLVQREYPAVASMVEQGKNGIGLFVIISGKADAVHIQPDGSRVVVNTFKAGDYFGEIALLDEGVRTASVIATEPTTCLALARWDFMALLKNDSEMTVSILTELARRFRMMLEV